ncbi:hypothetical protein [Dokdonella immobilis]|uniref:Uncharacterized protein n=1 Tax=Dokdonella immobilis TaxID=578942 RepID=A0A1I4Z9M3_9GAMM|nr:hypothetical protein [Dokdonella immobilis]SFN46992.1 hypothetical protein SAMN05216289_1244 [Dokdonella immobilis]
MKMTLAVARSEFVNNLVLKGLAKARGFCWIQMGDGFKAVVEPLFSQRHGILFGCALGLHSWRHQALVDRLLTGLTAGILSVRDGYKGIWYPYFTFGSNWYGFVDGVFEYIYIPDDLDGGRKACAERADFVVDALLPQLEEFASVKDLHRISGLAVYAGGPVDLALPMLAAFDDRLKDMDRLLDLTRLRGTSLSNDSYSIFRQRLKAFYESGVIQRVLTCESEESLSSIDWPSSATEAKHIY